MASPQYIQEESFPVWLLKTPERERCRQIDLRHGIAERLLESRDLCGIVVTALGGDYCDPDGDILVCRQQGIQLV